MTEETEKKENQESKEEYKESQKEARIRNLAISYYSRKDIQEAICQFCRNRETVPRYFEGFGKRPDSLEYPSEVLNQVRKGATSFHCSEEIWNNPLELSTDMKPEKVQELRTGWDLLIDIDCKWFDYSKIAAKAIVKSLELNGIKNLGIKFSGSKGFHIIVPWKAFPKEINNQQIKDLFPDIPRKIAGYLRFYAERILKSELPEDFYSQFKNTNLKTGIKCKNCQNISSEYIIVEYLCPFCRRQESRRFEKQEQVKNYKCPECRKDFIIKNQKKTNECKKCNMTSEKNPENFSQSIEADLFDLMGLDVVLVSPRHLFRTPYSLHEKTSLASIVITKQELENFQPMMADPLRVKTRNYYPEAEEGEARELLVSALDWHKEKTPVKKQEERKFEEIKIDKSRIVYPPCIELIMKGMQDGRKRAVFILINYFRSLGLEFEEVEAKLESWNKLNKPPLKQGYISSQISWARNQKKMLPPNCDKDYYKGIGVCSPDVLCPRIKNPVNYTIIKQRSPRRK